MRENHQNTILDRSGPRIKTAATVAVGQQGSSGKYATLNQPIKNRRGGNRGRRKREMKKEVDVRIGTLNVGAMTGKSREIVDMMERRKLDVLCLQETKWKESKARDLGAGYKLYYHGENGARNGVSVVVRGMHTNGGGDREEKEEFWEKLDEAVELIPKEKRLSIGADFNGHVGEGNSGDERVIGKYEYGARNHEGQAIVDFAHRTDMAVRNTFYSKRESHKVTYTSGDRHTQIDYILCCRMH
ncbi:uncharacterized protein LOC122259592 [Penaeus japonicus]|uniref:uncharacterized protein LOC122259592 n=1 Tax=Penaeus japonicus TaxID=27405 RepID=UPI001C70CB9D|nr:uncharacterized protein LOC122259592 [Penaeus japonicus]